MAKRIFFGIVLLSFLLVTLVTYHQIGSFHLYWLVLLYAFIGARDLRSEHSILRNYPVIGHFRYFFEFIRPEIQQYFVESDISGRPFNREQRSVVYQRSKNVMDTLAFGTRQNITEEGYHFAMHSLAPVHVEPHFERILVGNHQCKQPYSASRLNISAMSFGALGHTAIEALNWGAKLGNFYHNTGEGGLSPYHLIHEGDLVLQIGTGNFSFRNPDGSFSESLFKEKAAYASVKMIEIKLSQGAKPSHGGLLPGSKVDENIAAIRGIEPGKDCASPSTHPSIQTPLALIEFIQLVRELSEGKPVGIKICIGQKKQWFSICKAMIEFDIYPDFITIDGAEGGTGAAPLEFSNRLGLPLHDALSLVHNTLIGLDIRKHIRLIASGKVITGFDMVCNFALGADICNSARGMMFSLGCIQSLHCNTNACPTGIATQDPRRTNALIPELKSVRVKTFHYNTVKSCMELMGAMGIASPNLLTPKDIFVRADVCVSKTLADRYMQVEKSSFLENKIPECYADDWHASTVTSF